MTTTSTRKNVPAWTGEATVGSGFELTPIWDEHFAARWDALQRQGAEEPKPPVVKRPTVRKPRTPRNTPR